MFVLRNLTPMVSSLCKTIYILLILITVSILFFQNYIFQIQKCQILLWKIILNSTSPSLYDGPLLGYNVVNEVISLKNDEKNEIEQEEEEKQYLLELMKMQNEALKRIYKNTLDHEKKE